MRPAAAVTSLATAHHQQIQDRPIDDVGMIPVIDAAAHDHHRSTVGLQRVVGELARRMDHQFRIDARKFLLPARSVRSIGIVGVCALAAQSNIDAVVRQCQIIDGGDDLHSVGGLDLLDRHRSTDLRFIAPIIAEVRQHQFDHIIALVED